MMNCETEKKLKNSKIKYPSQVVFFADTQGGHYINAGAAYRQYGTFQGGVATTRHNNHPNFLLFDGHVKAFTENEFCPGSANYVHMWYDLDI